MKSRILAVLFAVVLTAGTLAGCGSSKKADDTKAETTDEKLALHIKENLHILKEKFEALNVKYDKISLKETK